MARRVNTTFLTILTCVVMGLIGIAVLASKFLIRESPDKYEAAGNVLLAEKKYEEAIKNFAHAVALQQGNPRLWVLYGDALNELTAQDPEYLRRARAAWESALAVAPDYTPALDRMMQYWSDLANLNLTQPEIFEGLQSTAKRMFAADPNNAAAEVAIVTSVIRPWLNGVEKDPRLIQESVNKLMELMKKYPENPDIPMFAAQAKLRQAERKRALDVQDREAAALVDEAAGIAEASVKRSPTAAMYFSAAQVYQAQELNDQANRDKWRQKKREMYAKAREVVRVEDPLYPQINIAAARSVIDDRPAAEKILRELFEKMPNDQQVRLALAELLAMDKQKQAEAIEILEKPFADSTLRGPKALMVREMQIDTLVILTNLHLDRYLLAREEERNKLIGPIREGIAKVEAKDGVNSPRALRLRGKLLRMQGELVEAIQTLERARQIADQRYGALREVGSGAERWEVIDLLAKAYIETNQMGQAKTLLTGLINRFPSYDPGRMLLTQILIKDGSYDEARPHVEYFKRKNPDDPNVLKFELQLQDPKALANARGMEEERRKMRETYSKLPESSKVEMLDKVNAAMVIENQEDAERLLNKLQQQFPGDYDVAQMAVRVYRATGELENAKQAVAEALKARPDDQRLQILSRQIADLTPENLLKIQEEEFMKNPDELVRNLGLASVARRRNQPQEALKYLQAAQKLKPDDENIMALLFGHHLWQQQWDRAEALLEPLSRANQDQAGGLLLRYRLAMAKQDYPAALNHANQLTQRMGEFGQSWLAVAQVRHAMNQFDEALKNYGAALEKQSDSAAALRGIIECYYALNRPGEARNKIRDARRAMPSNSYFRELEINHELTYGNPENAIPLREEQYRRQPELPGNVLALGRAYLATARTYAQKPDRQQQANQLFAKARETFRNGLTKWPDEIAFYADYAETNARSGQLGDSEQVLKQLAQREQWKGKSEPQVLLAEFYAIVGRHADAEAEFRAVLAREPKNAPVQIRLANLLVFQNKIDEAVKALAGNDDDPRVARRKVDILLGAERLEEADQVLEEMLVRAPKSVELLQMAASVQIQRNKFPEASQKLARALELEPENPTTHYYLGRLKMSEPKGNLEEAARHLTRGKDSPSMGTEARFAMAELLRRRNNDIDGAIRELESALQSQPGNLRVRLALIDEYLALQPPRSVDAERAIKEGKQLPGMAENPELMQREVEILATRDPAKAAELINKVLAANPDNEAVVRKSLDLLLKSRRYPDVNARVEEILAKNPDAWWAYRARAVAMRFLGRKDESLREFEAALDASVRVQDGAASSEIVRDMGDVLGADEAITRIRPRAEREDKWNIMIARLQQTKGDTEMAVKTLESVLAREDRLMPIDKINAYRFGGTLYLITGEAAKSRDCYLKLLDLVPTDMTALNNIAYVLGEIIDPPQPKEGVKYSQRAFDLMHKSGRRDAQVFDTHGWLLTLAGDVDRGIDVLRTSLQIKRLPDAHYHLGEAYMRKEFPDQALRELEMALDLYRSLRDQKQPVDPHLEGKIENALSRANIMTRQKKSTANVPSGVSVP